MNIFNIRRAGILVVTGILALSSCLGTRTSLYIDEEDVPDETRAIIVKTEMDNETAFQEMEQLLTKWGYALRPDTEIFEGIPSDFYVIAERRDADYIHMRLGIGISGRKNSEITIRGWYTARQYEGQPIDHLIMKEGYSGSIGREAWIEMFRLASDIDGVMRFE